MQEYFCVGTYTEPILFGTGAVFQGQGIGLYLCRFHEEQISVLQELPLRNPSFFCMNEEKHLIYAVNELKEYEGQFGGAVSEISYDENGALHLLRTLPTGGTDPCHVELSPSGELIVISNFADGSVSAFPLDTMGRLKAENRQLFQHKGQSVHPVRQRGPHAHSAIFQDSQTLFVPDLGTDRLEAYRCHAGRIEPDAAASITLPAGSGPRFGQFSMNSEFFYQINELASSVNVFHRESGTLQLIQTVTTLPADFHEDNICSDLHLSPDGRFLYASNRGHDSIVCFGIASNGLLTYRSRVSCRGKTPRNFCIDPSGNYLLVGNQDSDTIVVFAVGTGGQLIFINETHFPSPVCIRFFPCLKHAKSI